MAKYSDTYKGEDLKEKLEILEKVYFYHKKDSGDPNFFDTYMKKYSFGVGTKDTTLRDVDNFTRQMNDMCSEHVGYLENLVTRFEEKPAEEKSENDEEFSGIKDMDYWD